MIIEDKNISSGMFSKAGRLSLEVFTLLQLKDQILNGNGSTTSLKNSHTNENKNQKDNPFQQIHRSLRPDLSTKNLNNSQSNKNLQPFSKITSREYQHLLEDKKNNNSSYGRYNPKFHYVQKTSPLNIDNEFLNENKKRIKEFRTKIFDQIQENLNHNKKSSLHNNNNNNSMASSIQNTSEFQNQSIVSLSQPKKINNSVNDSSFQLYGLDFDKPRRKVPVPDFQRMSELSDQLVFNRMIRHY